MRSRIDEFEGPYFFLSNFFPEPLELGGEIFPSAEHAYQAAKTLDPVERETIRTAPTADDAKNLARTITLRSDWEKARIPAMARVLRAKFSGSPALRRSLLATGDAELVEGNDWGDEFWGVYRGRGTNHLGKLLMVLRNELRHGQD